MKEQPYVLVVGNTHRELELGVCDMIVTQGYVLHGSPFSASFNCGQDTELYQAMVKPSAVKETRAELLFGKEKEKELEKEVARVRSLTQTVQATRVPITENMREHMEEEVEQPKFFGRKE